MAQVMTHHDFRLARRLQLERLGYKFTRVHVIAAFVSVVFFAPLVWMALDRQLPFELVHGRVVPSEVAPGEEFEVVWDINIQRACRSGVVQREIILVDGTTIKYDAVPSQRPVSDKELRRKVTLSNRAGVAPGPARYRAHLCYSCNPLQHFWNVCTTTPDVPFVVLPPKDEPPPHK